MGSICIYEHWRPDPGQCFYVGKGSLRRSRDIVPSSGRNALYVAVWRELKTLGLEVEVRIVASELDEIPALILEAERITLYGRLDNGTGTLANRTDGGSGTNGMIHTAHSRQKIADGHLGQPLSAEHRAAVSKSLKGRPKSPEWSKKIGDAQRGRKKKPLSDITKARMSASLRGKPRSEEFKQKLREYHARRREERNK